MYVENGEFLTKRRNMKKRILFVLLICLFTVALSLFVACGDGLQNGEKEVTLTVVHKNGEEKVFVIESDEEFLGDALVAEGLVSGEEGAYGLFVTMVDGETADSSNQEWWCLTKGGETVMTGVDSTPFEDGDVFEFTLTIGW